MSTETKKTDVLKFLADSCSNWGTYHNHKEISAWAGLVLYIGILSQLVGPFNSTNTSCVRWFVTFVVIVLTAAVALYVIVQFRLREVAANITSACRSLIAEGLPKAESEIGTWDFTPVHVSGGWLLAGYDTPWIVHQKIGKIPPSGHKARIYLEAIIAVLIMGAFILALVRIWNGA